MVVIGAKGHAKEILNVLQEIDVRDDLYFFDDVTKSQETRFFSFPLIKGLQDLTQMFLSDPRFILGLGGTARRRDLVTKLKGMGGELTSIISPTAKISEFSRIGAGVNVMSYSSILGDAEIEDGVLVHSYCSIHHDCYIGAYSELSPGARILGYCKIGKNCSIGSNAVILPGVSLTDNVIIGAGAVVTKDITQEGIYAGTPSRKIK